MKIHTVILNQTAQALEEIFFENRFADKVIEKYLKSQKKWGSRDRKLFAETVYSCVRWWRYYLELLQIDQPTRHHFPSLIGLDLFLRKEVTTDWLPEGLKKEMQQKKIQLLQQNNISVLQSFPDWWLAEALEQTHNYLQTDFCSQRDDFFQDHFRGELSPKTWAHILAELNLPAPIDLRVNTLRISVKDLKGRLSQAEVETEPISSAPEGLTLVERKNVFQLEEFKKGFFEVQDRSSQKVALFTKPAAGLRVLDACAGAGGKTLHLGTLMKNKGKILAMDIHEWKLDELRRRASRNGLDLIETKVIENSKTLKRLENSFDRVLVDSPCSGSGVIRRNPDSKWKITLQRVREMEDTQAQLLDSFSACVRSDGFLVYSTCSIFPNENQRQVDRFLAQHSDFTLDEMETILPFKATGAGDGFFMARLKKKA